MSSRSNNIAEMLEVLISYAQGNYKERILNDFADSDLERLKIGVNMLGEELFDRTISKSYFYELFDAISDMVFLTDINFNILEYNLSVKEWFKLSSQDRYHVNIKDLFKDFDCCLDNTLLESIITSEKRPEITFRGNTEEMIAKLTASKVLSENKELKGYLFVIHDVSLDRRVQRQVMGAIISTEEKERRRISHDLHDSLGQELNALKMHIEMLLRLNVQGGDYSSVLEATKQIVTGSIANLKTISQNLLPPALNVGDLSFAILDMINKLSSSVDFIIDLPETVNMITKEVQTSVFRILQEFVNNSIKYSDCSKIQISINQIDDKLKVKIADNGNGFEMADFLNGNGISNIKSRLNILNADYTYNSIVDEGTFLSFEIHT